MSPKVAVAGKGGVGKTTLSAALVRSLARSGQRVLAVDADPNNCLGRALAFPEHLLDSITPLSDMKQLLAERAGTAEGGGFFALSPPVQDLLDKYAVEHDGIPLLVMGTVDQPGAGCVCPESAVLKALVRYLVGLGDVSLVVDMEAGLEHLGRGTARHVGALLVVTDPAPASARTAARVARLAKGLGLRLPGVVLNKATTPDAGTKVRPYLDGLEVFATLPSDPALAESEAVPASGPYADAVEELRAKLAQWLASEDN